MPLTYTTAQLAAELNTSRNLIDILRQEGALIGIKKGNGYIFHYREIERFLQEFAGMDMSNRQAIRESMVEIERRKRNERKS